MARTTHLPLHRGGLSLRRGQWFSVKKDRPRRTGLYESENYTRAAVMMAIL